MTRKKPANRLRKRGPVAWRGERGDWHARFPNRLKRRMKERAAQLSLKSLSEATYVVLEVALDAGDPELKAEIYRKNMDRQAR